MRESLGDHTRLSVSDDGCAARVELSIDRTGVLDGGPTRAGTFIHYHFW
jgi:hypothetical protein